MSSLSTITTKTLINTITRDVMAKMKKYRGEMNDGITRDRLADELSSFLYDVKANKSIVDFKVVCDETNNPPDVVFDGDLKVKIAIKPTPAAEIIMLDVSLNGLVEKTKWKLVHPEDESKWVIFELVENNVEVIYSDEDKRDYFGKAMARKRWDILVADGYIEEEV